MELGPPIRTVPIKGDLTVFNWEATAARCGWILSLILMTLSPALRAFQAWPEYEFFSSRELENRQRGSRIESPNFHSDASSFSLPRHWQNRWFTREEGVWLDGSYGSLSGRRFYAQNRLEIHKPITDSTAFRYIRVLHEDYYYAANRDFFELDQGLSERLGFSILGHLESQKKEIDVGGGLHYSPNAQTRHRLMAIFPNYALNKRSELDEKMVDRPMVLTWVGRGYSGPRQYWSAFIKYEKPLEWHTGTEPAIYQYSRFSTGALRNFTLDGHQDLFMQLEYEHRHESLTGLGGALVEEYSDSVRRYEALLTLDRRLNNSKGPDLWSLRFVRYDWRAEGRESEVTSVLPSFLYEIPVGPHSRADRVDLGAEAAVSWLELKRSGDEDATVNTHLRVNAGYRFVWTDRAELRLLATFDLKSFGNDKTWDGGAGQLWLVWPEI